MTAPIVAADPSVLDRQAARVEAARQALDAAQAQSDAAAGQVYTHGAGAGAGRDVTDPLGQAVFDARRELTEQTAILADLNQALGETGAGPVPVPALPENADVQAFPSEPPALERAASALAEGTKDAAKNVWDVTMPDVANMYDVATNWDEASGADRTQAVLDAAGMVPLPGAKILGEGIEHGLDALGSTTRHLDDAPTPQADVPSGGHSAPPTGDAPHGAGDLPSTDHTSDAGHVAAYSVEDTGALLVASENAGGHLIERHVGQTFDDLAARLESSQLQTVSTFRTADEAASAISTALQQNQQLLNDWVANGAPWKLELDSPFNGGSVLERSADEAVTGTSVKVVLKGDGNGGWYVLTGFPQP